MRILGSEVKSYIGQGHEALAKNPQWMSGNRVVVAGDFNSNSIWDDDDTTRRHSAVVKLLEGQGLVNDHVPLVVEVNLKDP